MPRPLFTVCQRRRAICVSKKEVVEPEVIVDDRVRCAGSTGPVTHVRRETLDLLVQERAQVPDEGLEAHLVVRRSRWARCGGPPG